MELLYLYHNMAGFILKLVCLMLAAFSHMLGELVKHINREYICFTISLAIILDQLLNFYMAF